MRRIAISPWHLEMIVGKTDAERVSKEYADLKYPVEIDVTDEMSFAGVVTEDVVEAEYAKRDTLRDRIKEIIDTIPLKPKSNTVNGSYYDYLCKIGNYYFTHSDFVSAIVRGYHSFYAFSENGALEYLKNHHKKQYAEISSLIDHRFGGKKIPDSLSNPFAA